MLRPAFENEREVRVLALSGTFAINLLLLFLLLYVRLWQSARPEPPRIEFVEVNFGTDQRGSGRIQTYNRANNSPRAEDVKRAEEKSSRTVPRVEKTPPVPVEEKVETPSRTAAEKPLITTKAESPVSTPVRPEPKKVESPRPTPPAPAKTEPVRKVETVDPNALYKRSAGRGGGNGTVGTATGTGGNSNGDDASGVGDKGNPGGKIDAKGLYGRPGGTGAGLSFDVSGWELASIATVRDESDETGLIVFQITVDQSGDVTAVRVKQTTVSPAVVEVYRRAVLKARLRPKSSATPLTSTGTVRYTIKSR